MAYTLKLNIYIFSLYRIIGEERRMMRGMERVKFQLEDDGKSRRNWFRALKSHPRRMAQ